ncbi:MAG: hypothetical protein K2H91_06665, partial [Lachnospiraceae bacterium]|nr:hypothetical protein [Lachnospiraceae bacterium]
LLRMEKGIRCVDYLTSSQLLDTIGKTADQFEQLLNDEDYGLWRARESIRKSIQQRKYGKVKEDLASYRTMKNNAPNLHEQFCLYQEVMMKAERLRSVGRVHYVPQDEQAELCETALRALHLTKPAFVFCGSGERQLYTSTEIELILLVVHYGTYCTDTQTEDMLLNLFRHVDYYYLERERQKIGYLILEELIELAQKLQDWDKELDYIDKGIDFVVQGREITGVARLHFLKAQALQRQCGAALAEDNVFRKEIQRECLMAYSVCEVFGDVCLMEAIKRFCEEELKWQITRLEM